MKLFISILIYITFTLFNNFSFGQDFVYGKVIDENGIAIYNAEVFWNSKDELNRDKQLTQPDGTFKIKILKDTTITISVKFPGKKDLKKYISQAEFYEFIVLEMEEKGLTSVTASRWEQDVNEIPASILIVTREEIALNGYSTVQEIIENVSGMFTIDHRTETDITMGVRGLWSPFNRNVMIQVNGVSMLSERQNDFNLSNINVAVEAIDKIEIVRGPMSVIYGAGAFFGVINIITNQTDIRSKGIVAAGYGSQSTIKSFARYAVEKDNNMISFNAMTYKRDGFKENWNDMVSDRGYVNPAVYQGTPGSIDYYKNKEVYNKMYSKIHQGFNLSARYDNFFTNINFAKSDVGFSFINPGPPDDQVTLTSFPNNPRNAYKSQTLNAQFGYASNIKNRFYYETKISYMNSFVDAEYQYDYVNEYNFGQNRVASLRSEINTKTTIFDSKRESKIDLDLLLGGSLNNNFENNSYYDSPKWESRNWYAGLKTGTALNTFAGYSQLDLKWKGLQFVAAGRLEQQADYNIVFDKNNDMYLPGSNIPSNTAVLTYPHAYVEDIVQSKLQFIPRLALIYSIDKKDSYGHFIRALYGESIRQATAVDNAGDIMWANEIRSQVGDDLLSYLKPESVKTYEFGYTLSQHKRRLDISVNYFHNDLFDPISRNVNDYGATVSNPWDRYNPESLNGKKRVTDGVELMLKKTFKKNFDNRYLRLDVNTNFTYQKSKVNDSNELIALVPFSPNILANGNLTGIYKLASNIKLGFGLSFNYVDKMASYIDINALTSYGEPIYSETGTYLGNNLYVNDYYRVSLNMRVSDIQLGKTIEGGIYVNFKIGNLFDQKYNYPVSSKNRFADKGFLGRGNELLLSMGYTF